MNRPRINETTGRCRQKPIAPTARRDVHIGLHSAKSSHANSRARNLARVDPAPSRRRLDFGELAAFLSLGLAASAAILLAVILNRDFPNGLDRATNRLSTAPTEVSSATAILTTNTTRTNQRAAQSDSIGRETSPRPGLPNLPLPPDPGLPPAQPPRPSV